MSRRPVPGRPYCKYCNRQLIAAELQRSDSFTFDHVRAQEVGGWRRVPCCRKCNMLKDNLPVDDWFWFIGAFSRWWKTFDTPAQVLDQVRAEHRRRAYANAGRELPV